VASNSITLYPSKDSEFQNDSPDWNNGTSAAISTGEEDISNTKYEMVVQFDLSSIPAQSFIESVSLKLVQFADRADGNGTLRTYRATQSWGETTVTYNNQPSYNTTSTGTTYLGNNIQGEKTVTIPTSLIQNWIEGTWSNYGFYIRATHTDREFESNATDDRFVQFRSREYGTVAERPRLIVGYTPPGGSFIIW